MVDGVSDDCAQPSDRPAIFCGFVEYQENRSRERAVQVADATVARTGNKLGRQSQMMALARAIFSVRVCAPIQVIPPRSTLWPAKGRSFLRVWRALETPLTLLLE